MPPTPLEIAESVDMMRVLENGYTIKMIETNSSLIGIDTLEDYNEALKKF